MSDVSLKEKLGARLDVAPPPSLAAGARYADERSWVDFLAQAAAEPDAFFLGLARELRWRTSPIAAGAPGDWFPGAALDLAEACLDVGDRDAPCLLWPAADGAILSATRAELAARVDDLAGRLGGLGLGPGERVAVLSDGGPDLAISLLACFRRGLAAVPGGLAAGHDATAVRIEAFGCRAALVGAGAAAPALDLPRLDVRCDGDVPAAEQAPLAVPPMHPALVFADGAGQPFALPAAGFAVQALSAYRHILDGRPGHTTWILSPPSHVATVASLVGALASGGTAGLAPAPGSPAQLGALLARLPGRTAVLDAGAIAALGAAIEAGAAGGAVYSGALELIAVEGTSLDPHLLQLLRDRLFGGKVHVVQALARPECGGFIAGPYPPVTRIRFSSVSHATPGLALEIVDAAGEPCAIGVGGMLALSRVPPSVALELQGAAPPVAIEVKARRDRDGNLWPLGEAHLALADSSRVNLAEIEAALAAVPGVEQVAVVRYVDADGRPASRAFAKAEAGAEVCPAALRAALEAKLGDAAAQTECTVVPELPYTRSGKLLRSVLRRISTGEPLTDEELAMIRDPVAAAALARRLP